MPSFDASSLGRQLVRRNPERQRDSAKSVFDDADVARTHSQQLFLSGRQAFEPFIGEGIADSLWCDPCGTVQDRRFEQRDDRALQRMIEGLIRKSQLPMRFLDAWFEGRIEPGGPIRIIDAAALAITAYRS